MAMLFGFTQLMSEEDPSPVLDGTEEDGLITEPI
jgi:hypothetical protein